VNLTTQQISSIETSQYETFARSWQRDCDLLDLCGGSRATGISKMPFDPRNIVTLMTRSLGLGTGLPYTSRTSVSGLAPAALAVNWFSRSNFGGNFSPMLEICRMGWA